MIGGALPALAWRSVVQSRYLLLGSVCLLAAFQLVIVGQASAIEEAHSFSRVAELVPAFLQRGLGSRSMLLATFTGYGRVRLLPSRRRCHDRRDRRLLRDRAGARGRGGLRGSDAGARRTAPRGDDSIAPARAGQRPRGHDADGHRHIARSSPVCVAILFGAARSDSRAAPRAPCGGGNVLRRDRPVHRVGRKALEHSLHDRRPRRHPALLPGLSRHRLAFDALVLLDFPVSLLPRARHHRLATESHSPTPRFSCPLRPRSPLAPIGASRGETCRCLRGSDLDSCTIDH